MENNKTNGKVAFGSLTFTANDTWKFLVKEDTSTARAGYTMDKSEYEVTFVVADGGKNDGVKSVTKTIKQVKDSTGKALDPAVDATEIGIKFTN